MWLLSCKTLLRSAELLAAKFKSTAILLRVCEDCRLVRMGGRKLLFHSLGRSSRNMKPDGSFPSAASPAWQVARKQLLALVSFLLLFIVLSVVLYSNDRQQEWRLRCEQATHQTELAFQLIDRDLDRVRSDVSLMARQGIVRSFLPADENSRQAVEYEFKNFLQSQNSYQQIRLLDLKGQEVIRVDWRNRAAEVISKNGLQNKQDRYYFRESLLLKTGDVFVSEFDLNQEHGEIEDPLNPVIRFVTPVVGENGEKDFLLVANYHGAPLLRELSTISSSGKVFLIREDGQYLLGPTQKDAWGWLLNHSRTFESRFKTAWAQRSDVDQACNLNSEGAFAFRQIQMRNTERAVAGQDEQVTAESQKLWLVSWLPRSEVFKNSQQLLNRLLILFATILIPLVVLTRIWANSTVRRAQQNEQIQQSEIRLRELSGRLVRIQEEERKAISREIHDQLGQQATAINLDLKLAAQEADSPTVKTQLGRAIAESEQLLETLHDFASRVRPVELDDLGLRDAVESYVANFSSRTGIKANFESNLDGKARLPDDVSANLFRLVQESLNNILKHANATGFDVSIEVTGAAPNEQLQLLVKDDGIGVEESSAGDDRLGILGMRERVDLLGGTFSLQSGKMTGTVVDVSIPVRI